MNNLKPNMYIRTKEGKIDKVLEINIEDFDEPVVRLASYPIGMYQGMFEYKKASHNIIDLIEVGDYVNGSKVINIGKETKTIFCELGHLTEEYHCKIKSIVTKEQFEAIKYEVK